MVKRFASLAGLTLVLGLVCAPAAHAGTRFSVQIGLPVLVAPVAVTPGPPPGYVWHPGYYVWTGFRYRWMPGAWVPSYVQGNWARERWEREHRDFDRGRDWERDHDRRDWDHGREWDNRGDWRR